MKKLVKGFASVILASMFVFIGCNQTTGGSKPFNKGPITITVKGDGGVEIVPENTFTADKNAK